MNLVNYIITFRENESIYLFITGFNATDTILDILIT